MFVTKVGAIAGIVRGAPDGRTKRSQIAEVDQTVRRVNELPKRNPQKSTQQQSIPTKLYLGKRQPRKIVPEL